MNTAHDGMPANQFFNSGDLILFKLNPAISAFTLGVAHGQGQRSLSCDASSTHHSSRQPSCCIVEVPDRIVSALAHKFFDKPAPSPWPNPPLPKTSAMSPPSRSWILERFLSSTSFLPVKLSGSRQQRR